MLFGLFNPLLSLPWKPILRSPQPIAVSMTGQNRARRSPIFAWPTGWSTNTATGREFRMALTVWDEGEEAARLHDLMGHVEDAVAALPRDLPGWRVASIAFVRSFIARDAAGPWAGLVEYRLRVLETI